MPPVSALPFADAVRRSPFTGATYVVHLMLADTVNEANEYEFWMSVPKLAAKARLNAGSVRRALREMEDAGWLEVVDGADPAERARRGRPTRYRLLLPDDAPIVYDERSHPAHTARGQRTDPAQAARCTPRTRRGDPAPDARVEHNGPQGEHAEGAEPTPGQRAKEVLDAWFGHYAQRHGAGKTPTAQPFVALMGVVTRLFENGWSRAEVARALLDVEAGTGGVVSVATMQLARSKARPGADSERVRAMLATTDTQAPEPAPEELADPDEARGAIEAWRTRRSRCAS